MKAYLIPIIIYIFTVPLANLFLNDQYISYALKVILVGITLFYFRKEYKLKFNIDFLSILTGMVIFLLWISLEGYYPKLGTSEFLFINAFSVIIKICGMLLIAPFIEELFLRGFLIRYLISKNWEKIPLGKFTWYSFIFTVLFFTLAHNRWLPALFAGIILNLLFYKKKNLESCILAHFIANLLLILYVFFTNSWFLL